MPPNSPLLLVKQSDNNLHQDPAGLFSAAAPSITESEEDCTNVSLASPQEMRRKSACEPEDFNTQDTATTLPHVTSPLIISDFSPTPLTKQTSLFTADSEVT